MKRLMALCAVLTVSGAVLTGCGSSDSGSTSSTGAAGAAASTTTAAAASGGSAAALAEAKANFAKLVSFPPKIEVPPLPKAPPTGVKLTFATCPVPTCTALQQGAQQAAKVLGWQVKLVNQGLAPDTVQSAWNAIAQDPGQGVIGASVLPNSAIQKQLTQVAKAKAPYVGIAQPDPPGPLMLAGVSSANQLAIEGEALADWVVIDAQGKPGQTIFVYDPTLAALNASQQEFHTRMKQLSPGTDVTDLKVSLADVGTKIPQEVVNEIRTHPDAKYVVFSLGDYATGVPQAIKAANLPSAPTLVTRATTTTNMQDIKNGSMAGGLTVETTEAGWRAVDLIARSLVGQKPYNTTPVAQMTFLTAKNLPADISVPYEIPGGHQAYETAWHK